MMLLILKMLYVSLGRAEQVFPMRKTASAVLV